MPSGTPVKGGERSPCRAAHSLDTDGWREAYWEHFETGATIKTAEWEHEQEYRLLLWSDMLISPKSLRGSFATIFLTYLG